MPIHNEAANHIWQAAKDRLNAALLEYDQMLRGADVSLDNAPFPEVTAFAEDSVLEIINWTDAVGIQINVPYRIVYFREHEMGSKPRMRIWTRQQAAYGQFDVIENAEFETLRRILGNMGYIFQEGE